MGLNLKQVFLGGAFFGVVAIVGCNPRSAESHLQDQTGFGEEKPSQETWPESFEWGRTANQNEIDSLSIAIPPSGKGLPDGEGLALRGKSIYLQKCAACHGLTGREGPEDVLVATGSLFSDKPGGERGIGNYWPYATTVFDYIRRAMPSNAPGSLSNQEVYDLTAWLLYQNELIDEDFILDAQTLPGIVMPAKIHFVNDNRTSGPNPTY